MAKSHFETIRPTEGGASRINIAQVAPFGAEKNPATGEIKVSIRGSGHRFEKTFSSAELLELSKGFELPTYALVNAIGNLASSAQAHKDAAIRLAGRPQLSVDEERELRYHVSAALRCTALVEVTRDGGGCYERYYARTLEELIRRGGRRAIGEDDL